MGMKIPNCPLCKGKMARRTSVYGPFYGCANYPQCKGTVKIQGKKKVDKESTDKAEEKMKMALEFVRNVGGTDEAFRYLNAISMVLEDEPETEPEIEPKAPGRYETVFGKKEERNAPTESDNGGNTSSEQDSGDTTSGGF